MEQYNLLTLSEIFSEETVKSCTINIFDKCNTAVLLLPLHKKHRFSLNRNISSSSNILFLLILEATVALITLMICVYRMTTNNYSIKIITYKTLNLYGYYDYSSRVFILSYTNITC